MRLLIAVALLLLLPTAAEARVIVVAGGGASATLIDTRTNAVTAQIALPGKTRAVAAG